MVILGHASVFDGLSFVTEFELLRILRQSATM
jgi:hypothetical protein